MCAETINVTGKAVSRVVFSPDGKCVFLVQMTSFDVGCRKLAVGAHDSTIYLYNGETFALISTLKVRMPPRLSIAHRGTGAQWRRAAH